MVAGVKRIGSKVTDMFVDWARKDADAQQEAVKRLGLPKSNTAQDRAKAMGFGDDVYHGTNKSIDGFDPKKTTTNIEATYLARDPDIAGMFSNSEGLYDGSMVMPLKIKGDYFDYNNPKHYSRLDEAFKQGDNLGYDNSYNWKDAHNMEEFKAGDWEQFENKPFSNLTKKAGFDGVNLKEFDTQKLDNVAVYNPANIRSKFAHFNPKMAGVGAGSVMSGNLMADELDLEHKPKVSAWDSLMNTISGANQQQAQAYGDTGAGAMNIAHMLATDPAVAGEVISTVGLKGIGAVSPYIKGFGVGLALDSGEASAAERPGFFEELQKKRIR